MDLAGKVAVVRGSKLFRVFYTTGFSTGIKILASILVSKIIAVQLGPYGLALLGQLSNFVTIALLVATGGFNNGVIKYVSELGQTQENRNFIQQSFKLTFYIAVVVGIILVFLRNQFSLLNFNSAEYSYVFLSLGVSIIFYACGNYFISFLNGLSDFTTYNRVNAINSIVSLIFNASLIYFYGLTGAFVAVAVNQAFSFVIVLFFSRKYLHFFRGFLRVSFQKKWLKNLSQFSMMALVTAMLAPTTQILIRKTLLSTYGTTSAGEWEAMVRLSNLYLTLIMNIMLVYYLPKLSQENDKLELKKEIFKGFKFFTPIVVVSALAIYFMRSFIVTTLLSAEFRGMETFFVPQLIGDIFKVLSFLYAYLVIAKRLTTFFIISEIITSFIYVGMSYFLMQKYGVIGAIYGYTVTFMLYFLLQYFFMGKLFLNENYNTRSWLWGGRGK